MNLKDISNFFSFVIIMRYLPPINNYVCKSFYYECLIKELGINNNTSGNTTYKPTSFDKDEMLANHRSFMTSLNIPSGRE
jgi:hypothetical protein